MEINGSFKICLLVLVLISHTLITFAQIPPTCCPDPISDDKFNATPYLLAGGGLILVGGTYYYLKKKAVKTPIQGHLPSYLLTRNILPNEDALNLMYALNPNLSSSEVIKENKKLKDPDFPDLPSMQMYYSLDTLLISQVSSQILASQIGIFSSNIKLFKDTELSYPSPDTNIPKKIESNLTEIEKGLLNVEKNLTQNSEVFTALINDLTSVLNQTIERNIKEKSVDEKDAILIHQILEDLNDLLYPDLTAFNSDQSFNNFPNIFNDSNRILLASNNRKLSGQELNIESDILTISANGMSLNYNPNLLKGFAFAVYTYDENGEIISKGTEVEGRFSIKYVLPALKDEVRTYKETDGLASYALALLPPAKLYLIVSDISEGGKTVPLQNPLIDFKVAFRNTSREMINDQEFIIVPIYLSK